MLGQVERERAWSTVHDGAVYLHLGRQYLVQSLDLQARAAVVDEVQVDWYTQPRKESTTTIEEALQVERTCGVDLHFGRIAVTEQVVAYQRKAIADGSTIETVPLDLPETTFETEAVWFCPDDALLDGIDEMPVLLGALHAAEHSLIALLPLQAMCDRWDIGGLSTNVHQQTGRPTIFVYDGHAGGAGLTERGFARFAGWTADTARMLAGCPCSHGLPVVRAEPEVRQPQRLPRQEGGEDAAGAHGRVVGRLLRTSQPARASKQPDPSDSGRAAGGNTSLKRTEPRHDNTRARLVLSTGCSAAVSDDGRIAAASCSAARRVEPSCRCEREPGRRRIGFRRAR